MDTFVSNVTFEDPYSNETLIRAGRTLCCFRRVCCCSDE